MTRTSIMMVLALASLTACGKKADDAKKGSGDKGSADKMGSADKGSADKMGSADKGSADKGSADKGSAAGSGSGSAMAGSGSGAGSGSAAGSGAGSGSGSGAGSGSGSAAATPPMAPPPEGKVNGLRDGKDIGLFDGTKAVLVKNKDQRIIVIGPDSCAKFACDYAGKDGTGSEKFGKDCGGAILDLTVNDENNKGEPKVGASKFSAYVGSSSGGGAFSSDFVDGVTFSEVAKDHVTGKIDFKDGAYEIHGTFKAKVCP